jgi:hypothetical protein
MTLPRSHSRAWTRFSNVTPIDALQEIYETAGIRTSSHSVAVRSQRVSHNCALLRRDGRTLRACSEAG